MKENYTHRTSKFNAIAPPHSILAGLPHLRASNQDHLFDFKTKGRDLLFVNREITLTVLQLLPSLDPILVTNGGHRLTFTI